MIVALIGSGGRENALAYKLAESKSLTKLYVLPGNPGTSKYGENIAITENSKIIEFCRDNNVDLVVIGPEKYLVEGLADGLREVGIKVFGPSQNAAEIEGNKSFSKDLMQKYNIPTAKYKTFNREQVVGARRYLVEHDYPVVIKASGLAAGKGVAICNSFEEANCYIDELFEKNIFGGAGHTIVIEEFMEGEEVSVFAITDGNDFFILPTAQDHKRINDDDKGKNTGGMGAYAPAPIANNVLMETIENEIVKPTLKALQGEDRPFVGCLYCGLMVKDGKVKVVEYNCRFGDPETQAVVPLLEGDFAKLLYSCALGKIDKNTVKYNGGAAVCVVLASKGYPDTFEKGFIIEGLNNISDENCIIFHSGTAYKDNNIITNGGRVLSVIVYDNKNDLIACKTKCYSEILKVNYANIHYRKDIGDKGINYINSLLKK
ncbi:MAG TPA: phosphoribosylamine--glycine ligase [Melioribacteraceae bacterium]|nr:phosphoribosylamine--glycine ligase [Melioribacteraceae bacterium]